MPKKHQVIIRHKTARQAEASRHLLTDLKNHRCGVRAIACGLRRNLQGATIKDE